MMTSWKSFWIRQTRIRFPDRWQEGFRSDIHALITMADDNLDELKSAVRTLVASLVGIGDVMTIEEGTVLRRKNAAGRDEPVEHFGYYRASATRCSRVKTWKNSCRRIRQMQLGIRVHA